MNLKHLNRKRERTRQIEKERRLKRTTYTVYYKRFFSVFPLFLYSRFELKQAGNNRFIPASTVDKTRLGAMYRHFVSIFMTSFTRLAVPLRKVTLFLSVT